MIKPGFFIVQKKATGDEELYTIGDVKKVLVKDNEWFMEYIKCVAKRISKVNGELELIMPMSNYAPGYSCTFPDLFRIEFR